jgi:hypothetical protein
MLHAQVEDISAANGSIPHAGLLRFYEFVQHDETAGSSSQDTIDTESITEILERIYQRSLYRTYDYLNVFHVELMMRSYEINNQGSLSPAERDRFVMCVIEALPILLWKTAVIKVGGNVNMAATNMNHYTSADDFLARFVPLLETYTRHAVLNILVHRIEHMEWIRTAILRQKGTNPGFQPRGYNQLCSL